MRTLSLFATAASLIAAVAGAGSREHDGRESPASTKPLRIMVVGDSITHGHEGDFTWRYHIWEWFRANNVSVDFVGPYKGTIDVGHPLPPQPPYVIGDEAPPLFGKARIPWGYAEAVPKDFDSDHFSTGGYKAQLAKEVIRDLAKQYQPELVLCLIGINDFIWSLDSPEGLLDSTKTIIEEIRVVNPRAKFAVGNVVHRGFRDAALDERTDKFNPLLAKEIPSWSTKQSPIHYVDVASAYSCGPDHPHCPAAFDQLHPSALGNYQIAQVFAQTLIDKFDIGHETLHIPAVMPINRVFRVPKNLKAESSPTGVKVTWDHNYGMTSYKVMWRTGVQPWTEQHVEMNRFDTITETAGTLYQYKIRACHGDRCSAFSEVVEAVSDRHTAPPPRDFHMVSENSQFRVSWSPPENSSNWNITMYEISMRNMAETNWNSVGSRRFSETITGFFGLPKGSIWSVRMATWTHPEGKGLYAYTRPVVEGGGKPEQPKNLQAKYTTHTSASLTWNASANAAAYLIYYRSIGGQRPGPFMTTGDMVMGPLPQTTVQGLVLGRGAFEFCVTAVNGDAESKAECGTPGASNMKWHPVDVLGSLTMNSTLWVCALLLVVIFLLMARRRRGACSIR